jgi:hypothetical protein
MSAFFAKQTMAWIWLADPVRLEYRRRDRVVVTQAQAAVGAAMTSWAAPVWRCDYRPLRLG